VGLTIPWNCKPSGEPYYKPPGLLIQYDEYYPYILLCDFKSLWQQDDLMDAANLTLKVWWSPWSWLWSLEMIVIHFVWIHKIIINIWIWGRRRANCCWSYYVFLYDCCSAPCKWKMRTEHHYSANTTTTTTIKNDKKKHSPWIAAVPPLLLPQDDVWRVVVVLDFLHRRDEE